jgi:hypothetical protein
MFAVATAWPSDGRGGRRPRPRPRRSSESFEPRQRHGNHDIACNTLPYNFAQLGLPPHDADRHKCRLAAGNMPALGHRAEYFAITLVSSQVGNSQRLPHWQRSDS